MFPYVKGSEPNSVHMGGILHGVAVQPLVTSMLGLPLYFFIESLWF